MKYLSFLISLSVCECYNILVIFPHFGRSHFNTYEFLFKTLAAKEHNVTVISFFPQKKPIPYYNDVPITSEENLTGLEKLTLDMFRHPKFVMHTVPFFARDLANHACSIFLSNSNLQNFIKQNNKFDVILLELFNTNCHMGIA